MWGAPSCLGDLKICLGVEITWLHRFPKQVYQFILLSESVPAKVLCISHCVKSGFLSLCVCCHFLSQWNSKASWTSGNHHSLAPDCPNSEQLKLKNKSRVQYEKVLQNHDHSPMCIFISLFLNGFGVNLSFTGPAGTQKDLFRTCRWIECRCLFL